MFKSKRVFKIYLQTLRKNIHLESLSPRRLSLSSDMFLNAGQIKKITDNQLKELPTEKTIKSLRLLGH